MPTDATIERQVMREFQGMENAAASMNPGILDMLEVYGNAADALRQAEAYLDILSPRPVCSTGDRPNP